MKASYDENEVLAHIVSILRANGPIAVTALGQMINKELGPDAGLWIKSQHKGLRPLLSKYKSIFRLRGKASHLVLDLTQEFLEKDRKPTVIEPVICGGNIKNIKNQKSGGNIDRSLERFSDDRWLDIYLRKINAAIRSDSTRALAVLLRIANNPHSVRLGLDIVLENGDDDFPNHIVEQVSASVQSPFWRKIVLEHLRACANFVRSNYRRTNDAKINILDFYQKQLREDENVTFSVSVWSSILLDVRQLARWADSSIQASGLPSENYLNSATAALNEALSFVSGRAPPARQVGALAVINSLFRIYFYLNTTKLCNTVVDNINRLPNLEKYPVSHYVTCKFFQGKYKMYSGHYLQASKDLSCAFAKCLKAYQKNRRAILLYLIPVKMLLGSFPTSAALEKYQLPEFKYVSQAVQSGNIRLFEQQLADNEKFLERGIYMILRKLIVVLYRNLLKKVYLIGNKNAKVSISTFQYALQWQGMDATLDEAKCIIANLIADKYIKGYISHKANTLVLSITKPFVKNWIQ